MSALLSQNNIYKLSIKHYRPVPRVYNNSLYLSSFKSGMKKSPYISQKSRLYAVSSFEFLIKACKSRPPYSSVLSLNTNTCMRIIPNSRRV